MLFRMMMAAALAATTPAAPAVAQTAGSGSMGSGSIGSGGSTDTRSGRMNTDGTTDTRTMAPAPPLTRAQIASAKRCQAMTPARMARNATCMKMQKAHPDMMAPSGI